MSKDIILRGFYRIIKQNNLIASYEDRVYHEESLSAAINNARINGLRGNPVLVLPQQNIKLVEEYYYIK